MPQLENHVFPPSVLSHYTIEIHIREVVLSLVGKYFVSFGPPSVMMYILSAFCMLWTHPRSIMYSPEVPNLKVLYQREIYQYYKKRKQKMYRIPLNKILRLSILTRKNRFPANRSSPNNTTTRQALCCRKFSPLSQVMIHSNHTDFRVFFCCGPFWKSEKASCLTAYDIMISETEYTIYPLIFTFSAFSAIIINGIL